MTDATSQDKGFDRSADVRLMEAVEEISHKIQDGEEVDLERYTARFPEKAKYLRQLVVTLKEVAALGETEHNDTSGKPSLKQIGDFKLVRQIASGGMGIVYEAQEQTLDRRVALKVLRFAGLLDDRQLTRFKNEARAAATLHHPNIVPVFHVGSERGLNYYAMQYIDGPSLAEVVTFLANDREFDGGELPLGNIPRDVQRDLQRSVSTHGNREPNSFFGRVIRWGIQASKALDYAHQQGVLHRDIKPGNLLVDRSSNLWITDFGLARLGNDATLTASGELFGTIRYMSPEQASARNSHVDHRSDVYSLGVTLYELLTLRPAFVGENRQEILKNIVFNEPVRLRQINPRIPDEIQNIVLKAVAKNPWDRYQTAAELGEDLERFLENKPVIAQRPSALRRMQKWVRRNPVISASAFLIFVSLSIALSVAVWSAWRVSQSARATERLLYLADMRLATISLKHNKVVHAREILSRHIPRDASLDRRGFAWHYLWKHAHPSALTFQEHRAAVRSVACSPSGTLVASGDDLGEIKIWDFTSGAVYKSLPTGSDAIVALEFFRDGKTLCAGTESGHLMRIDIEKAEITHAQRAPNAEAIVQIVVSAETNTIIAASQNGIVTSWDFSSHEVELVQVGGDELFAICRNETGLVAARVFQEKNTLQLWDQDRGSLLGEYPLPATLRRVVPSADHQFLACGTSSGEVCLLNLIERRMVCDLKASRQRIYDLGISSDGSLLAAAGKDQAVHLIAVSTGDVISSFAGHEGRVYGVDFADNGRLLITASADQTCRVFPIDYERAQALPHSEMVSTAGLARDGTCLFWAEHSGKMQIQRGSRTVNLGLQHVYNPSAVFSPDGTRLVTLRTQLLGGESAQSDSTYAYKADVDLDGDLDVVAALGDSFRQVWQEASPTGKPGPIRSAVFGKNTQVAQLCRTGNLANTICRMVTIDGFLHFHSTGEPAKKVRVNEGRFEAVLVDDLDADGLTEIVYRDPDHKNYMLATVSQDLKAQNSIETSVELVHPAWFAAHDVDGDGLRDIVIASPAEGGVFWLRHRREFRFGPMQLLAEGLENPELVVFADANGDDVDDLVTTHEGEVVALVNSAPGIYGVPSTVVQDLEDVHFAHNIADIAVWDVSSGKRINKLTSLAWNSTVAAISPDNRMLATCGSDRVVRIFDVESSNQTRMLALSDTRVNALDFSSQGSLLAIGHGDDAVVWDLSNNSNVARLQGHGSTVINLLFHPHENVLVTLSDDQSVRFWEMPSGRNDRTLFEFDGTPQVACFLDNGRTLAIGTAAGTVSIWDFESGQKVTEVTGFGGQFKSLGYGDGELMGVIQDFNREFKTIAITTRD